MLPGCHSSRLAISRMMGAMSGASVTVVTVELMSHGTRVVVRGRRCAHQFCGLKSPACPFASPARVTLIG